MKIGELAKRSGLTAHTIRYYERIGLLPRASRRSSQREYDASILPWIEFLGRLKTTGMPVRDMVRYAKLREDGASTAAGRQEILVQHRAGLCARIAALQACMSVLDIKIAGYGDRNETENDNDGHPRFQRKPVRARTARSF